MQTFHRFHIGDSRDLSGVATESVHLVVTSPPYPMVGMWDEAFAVMVPEVAGLLAGFQGMAAFEAMHGALDQVWAECARVLSPGGFCCINIGDATRSLGESFCLYPNQARITMGMLRIGLTPLPDILWRKPTNAPNKFMGSGMLPAGAYVTYEHEYVLVFRKGAKRSFSSTEARLRRESAYFWEERNLWFSDLWSDLRGTQQRLKEDAHRERSAAFPLELPHRLVQMYSLQGDTVLDPFAGTGTTMAAALATGRSSIGMEWQADLRPMVEKTMKASLEAAKGRGQERLAAHRRWAEGRAEEGKPCGHVSSVYGFPVMTGQEVELCLKAPIALRGGAEEGWEATVQAVEEMPRWGSLFRSGK